MTLPILQRVNDAQLEADAWRETAARWRKRAMREGAPWRRKCRKLEAELDSANERGASLAENIIELEHDLHLRRDPLERECDSLRKSLDDAEKKREAFEAEVRSFKRKMGTTGSMESLVVERDSLREQVVEMKSRMSRDARAMTDAQSRAYKAEQDAADTKERHGREQVMPAKARIRVLATRLGIEPSWPGYSDDEKLTAELDARILKLQKSAIG